MASRVENERRKQDSTAELVSTYGLSPITRHEKGGNRLSWTSITLDTWCLEGVSVAFNVACLISIYGVLIAYDGKERPRIVYDISLNTIISILATACKTSLVFVVGAGISQLKWLWFQNSRQLSYMQTFEDASRGPLGAIYLLFRHQGRSMASLGAMILILTLAFEPMVQQILSYPTEPVVTASDTLAAAAPQSRYFGSDVSTTEMYSPYYLGVWSTDFDLSPSCPSGNCTWPKYRSVGVCSQCSDMTSTATLHCPSPTQKGYDEELGAYVQGKCEVVVPQGHSSDTNITLTYSGGDLASISVDTDTVWEVASIPPTYAPILSNRTYSNIKNPLVTFAHASLVIDIDRIFSSNASNPSEGISINKVTQCSLTYCVQDYDVSMINGKALVVKSAPDFGETFTHRANESSFICWRPSQSDPTLVYEPPYNPPVNATEFAFCNYVDVRLMDSVLAGSMRNTTRRASPNSTSDASQWAQFLQFTGKGIGTIGRITDLGLDIIAPRVADSITLVNLQSANATSIPGTIYTNQVIVRVQWPWMILPTLLVLLGNAFLAYTMYKSRKRILWKSSLLALLFHGLDDETAAKRDDCTTGSRMEKMAEDMYVRLQASESDRHLMLRERSRVEVRSANFEYRNAIS